MKKTMKAVGKLVLAIVLTTVIVMILARIVRADPVIDAVKQNAAVENVNRPGFVGG